MASSSIRPHLVTADEHGNIYDHPQWLMVCRKGREFSLPRPDELMPLPKGGELFLLPGRHAVGFDPESGEVKVSEDVAVAARIAPPLLLAAHPAYDAEKSAPGLPPFAYGAVGFADDRFYICARQTDAAAPPTGGDALRVTLNSCREEPYNRYHQSDNASFAQVLADIRRAKGEGRPVVLNLLFFPGFTDTEDESAAILHLAETF